MAAALPAAGGPAGLPSPTASDPRIYIEGNANFTSANGVVGGSGSPGDPFLISGWSIDASGGYGIQVRNTTASFAVEDVNITNPNAGPPYPPPILLWNVTHARVQGANLSGNVGTIGLTFVTDVSLVNINATSAPSTGLDVAYGENITLTGCIRCGPVTASADNLTIASNRFAAPSLLKVVGSRFVRITDNLAPAGMIRLNGTRDALVSGNQASQIWLAYGATWNTTVASNDLIGVPGGYTINAQWTSNLTLKDNNVSGSSVNAVTIGGSSNVTVVDNRVSDNPVGIAISRSQDVTVYGNDFVQNTVQASVAGSTRVRWNATYPIGGNHWSNYTGVDECSGPNQQTCPPPDGFGDTPFVIDATDEDAYPVMAFIGTDRAPPVVSITSPSEGASFTASPIIVTGSAYDLGGSGLQLVQVRDNGGAWSAATGKGSWSASVNLSPGTNRIDAEALDGAGNPSALASANVTYTPSPPPQNTPPYANFTWTPSTGNVSTPFTFTSTSYDAQDPSGSLRVRWDWESDGTWDTPWTTNATAAHTFAVPRAYYVTLEVMDTGGLTSNATGMLVVTEIPPPPPPALVATIAAHPLAGTMPLTVTFNSTVSGGLAPYQYEWHFGDGATSPAANTVHIYVTGGDFTVWLVVYDAQPSSVVSNVVYVNVTPAAVNLTVTLPTEFVSSSDGVTVTFSASATGGTPPYTFAWDFGDGGRGTGASVTHTYSSWGTYTVTVTVRDAQGQTVAHAYQVPIVGNSGPPPTPFYLTPLGLVVLGAAVVAVAGAAFAIARRRRRRTPPPT